MSAHASRVLLFPALAAGARRMPPTRKPPNPARGGSNNLGPPAQNNEGPRAAGFGKDGTPARTDDAVDETFPPEPFDADVTGEPTLYDRLGGADALEAAVELFYNKVLEDERVRDFFAETDMDKLRREQFNFMRHVFRAREGADAARRVFSAHAPMILTGGLGAEHFDAIAHNLKATLEELDVADDVVREAVSTVAPLRDVFDREKNESMRADASGEGG